MADSSESSGDVGDGEGAGRGSNEKNHGAVEASGCIPVENEGAEEVKNGGDEEDESNVDGFDFFNESGGFRDVGLGLSDEGEDFRKDGVIGVFSDLHNETAGTVDGAAENGVAGFFFDG